MITYYAKRSSTTAHTDEDRAMSSADVYKGESFDEAKAQLVAYMRREVQSRTEGSYITSSGLRQAADIMDAEPKVRAMSFDYVCKAWERETATAGILQYQIVRVER